MLGQLGVQRMLPYARHDRSKPRHTWAATIGLSGVPKIEDVKARMDFGRVGLGTDGSRGTEYVY